MKLNINLNSFKKKPEYLLILSWHISRELIKNLRKKGYKGKFIIPLPNPKIVRKYNQMDKFLKFLSNKYILSILFINIFFFLLTFNNPWTLDDYGYFSAGKLYNLINNKVISFEPFIFGSGYGLHLESRYMPLFYFLNQL